MMRTVPIFALLLGTLVAAPAAARDASCHIQSGNKVVLNQIYDFKPTDNNGSFNLSSRDGKQGALFPDILSLSVTVIKPGVAEVRGLTAAGINSRWGEARRSPKDGACWEGDDFQVCAR